MSASCRIIDESAPLEIEYRTYLPEALKVSLQMQVSKHKTLEDVVRWGLAQKPPKLIADVVAMDEFNQDVVIEFSPSVWLVYDTT